MTTVTKFSDLDLTKQYSYSDYLLWQFKERVELIKGFIMKMSPAPSMVHQRISNNLAGSFYVNFKRKPCNVFAAPFDVRLPIPSAKKDSTVVQPDLCIICDESKLDKRGCNGTPDLMVEIISPNNSKHDVHTKFNLYQEAGVKEYWIIEPFDKIILVYTLINGEFIGLKPQVEGENIKSPLFPELDIAIEDVFYKV
ncbi:Uma2 family endonuclease [Flavobacterium sp. ZT3R18]|uniref:Uma2 family endonuclease n=1 Tax=Flavobacterium sp. ZT3R18 TaxID=2594429 RepID=UPI00117BB170|nr:Uma2 family endonuclease [Flavobacterium sp. ZT3R18]TRX37901.1 Uma2 family endonuclease [Flavobacterium sp. ZT3R18]